MLAVFALCGISLVAISYWKSSVEGIGFYLLAFGTGALSGAGFLAMLASWFQFLALQAEQEKSEDAFLSRFGELQAKSRKLRDELRKHSSSG